VAPLAGAEEKHLHEALVERSPDQATKYLYRLFADLKGKFNGSMFDQDLVAERALIAPHMPNIIAFLRGDQVGSGQQTFGFWAYDFKFIPIETISGIYENFLT